MSEAPSREPVIVVHQAGSSTEAVVIRSLLRSVGIASPASTFTDPFPMREPPKGTHGAEILVLASQADQARRIIADYLAGAARVEAGQEDSEEQTTE